MPIRLKTKPIPEMSNPAFSEGLKPVEKNPSENPKNPQIQNPNKESGINANIRIKPVNLKKSEFDFYEMKLSDDSKPQNVIEKEQLNKLENTHIDSEIKSDNIESRKNMLKNSKYLLWGSLAFSILVFLVAFSFYSISAHSKQADYINRCQDLLSSYESTSDLKSQTVSCPEYSVASTLLNRYGSQNLTSKIEKLEQEKEFLQEEISELEPEFEALQNQLQGLEVEFEDIQNTELNKRRSELQEKIKQAEPLIGENEIKVTVLTREMKAHSQGYSDLNLNEYKEKISSFEQKSQADKNINYSSLKNSFLEMQDKIVNHIEEKSGLEGMDKDTFKTEYFSYRFFSNQEFVDLGDVHTSPDDEIDVYQIEITGNREADRVIIDAALARGYKYRKSANTDNLQVFEDDILGDPKIFSDLNDLVAEQRNLGIEVDVTSIFRSAEDQRELFLKRLSDNAGVVDETEYSEEKLISGELKDTLNHTLKMTSIPNFSKHHTGITVDFTQDKENIGVIAFEDTRSYTWLSRNNYFNAKRFGFVPSYPSGVENMGPDPEPWEYIYVDKSDIKLELDI